MNGPANAWRPALPSRTPWGSHRHFLWLGTRLLDPDLDRLRARNQTHI